MVFNPKYAFPALLLLGALHHWVIADAPQIDGTYVFDDLIDPVIDVPVVPLPPFSAYCEDPYEAGYSVYFRCRYGAGPPVIPCPTCASVATRACEMLWEGCPSWELTDYVDCVLGAWDAEDLDPGCESE